jgi:hypothetical protein
MKIVPGDPVIVVLHSPREKLLGLVADLNPSGVTVRSIDLSYFDDWCRSISAGEAHLRMSDNFYPMWRVERITRDEANGEMPSMADQFEARTGRCFYDE